MRLAPELASADFCGGCHQFAFKTSQLPDSFFGDLQQASMEEFLEFRQHSGLDLKCQDCHMPLDPEVLNGADLNTPFSLIAGCPGAIWGAANFCPRETVALYELIRDGQYDAALALWRRMFPSIAYCEFNDYIPAVKAAGRMMGFDGGTVRAPVCEIGPNEEAKLATALASLGGEGTEVKQAAG